VTATISNESFFKRASLRILGQYAQTLITIDPVDLESFEIGWDGQDMADVFTNLAKALREINTSADFDFSKKPRSEADVATAHRLAVACEIAAYTVCFIHGPARETRWRCIWELVAALDPPDIETELARMRQEVSELRRACEHRCQGTNEEGLPDYETQYRCETRLALAGVELRGAEKIAALTRVERVKVGQ